MEFQVKIYRDPAMLLDKVCFLARDRVVISGTVAQGRFSGLFDGDYAVDGKTVRVFVRRKPLFVSWQMVKKGLEYLAA
jgi:hypothetical protein